MTRTMTFGLGALFGAALAVATPFVMRAGSEVASILMATQPTPVQPPPAAGAPSPLPPAAAPAPEALLPVPPEAAAAPTAAPVPPAVTPPQVAMPATPVEPTMARLPAASPPAATAGAAQPSASEPPRRPLIIPVEGVRATQLTDTYNDRRGDAQAHEALDILATRGTPVLAVADGRIVKLFDSKPGGRTLYQFDPDETVAYYYAHLEGYERGIAEGVQVKQGQVIGYVGSSGNASADAPHLHFAIFQLGPAKLWWQGTPVNPYPLLTGR